MDYGMLHCIFCAEPLNPPILKCKGGHMASVRCDSERPRTMCHLCLEPSGGFKHDPAMDAVVSAATAGCSNSSCRSLVVYHKARDHKIACPLTPCACPEPGCNFALPLAELVIHLAKVHSIEVHKLPPYDTTKVFHDVPVPATIVSIVCVRAKACVWPLYMVSMWADRPSTSSADRPSRTETVTVLLEASSSTVPGNVVLDDLSLYLSVPPGYLSGETFKTLRLSIRIRKENDPHKGLNYPSDQDAMRRGAYDLMVFSKDARDD